MKRNLRLARTLLELIQNFDHDNSGIYHSDFYAMVNTAFVLAPGEDLEITVDYHLYLLDLEGFVLREDDEVGEDGEQGESSYSLTWAGHDYLDAHRV